MAYPPRLQRFVEDFTRLMDRAAGDEPEIMRCGGDLLATLVEQDDWLPEEYSRPQAQYYQQYLLHCDPQERFSVVSFVWGPAQATPVHDHTVWGLIGMLRGAERSERFEAGQNGEPLRKTGEEILQARQTDCVSPTVGDVHRVSNFYTDRVSISIHVYGANIGKVERHTFEVNTGLRKSFVSGYANTPQAVA